MRFVNVSPGLEGADDVGMADRQRGTNRCAGPARRHEVVCDRREGVEGCRPLRVGAAVHDRVEARMKLDRRFGQHLTHRADPVRDVDRALTHVAADLLE